MGLRWPRSERYGAQGPPWLYPQKVQSRAVTLLGERSTGQKRTQRASSLILGQPPSASAAISRTFHCLSFSASISGLVARVSPI